MDINLLYHMQDLDDLVSLMTLFTEKKPRTDTDSLSNYLIRQIKDKLLPLLKIQNGKLQVHVHKLKLKGF